MNNQLLATVDLGSNSFRLLIASIREDGSLQPVDEIKETIRLAGGLDEKNNLSSESMERALAVLSRFGERLIGFSSSGVRVVATSTLRVAKNADEFILRGNKKLGFNIEVISGTEEARLIYIGAMYSLAYMEEKRLVIDIGGGSTEFIIGTGYTPQIMESVTMGCVTFSNRFFKHGELDENNFVNAIFTARSKIQAMEHLFVRHDWSLAIGTSGTARALYDLCLQHGFSEQITLDGLYQLRQLFIQHKNLRNLQELGVKSDRRPVIAGGLAIMTAILEELKIDSMTIADGALREGVMYDLLGRESNKDLRVTTVLLLKKHYRIDKAQAARVSAVTLKLYRDINYLNSNEKHRAKGIAKRNLSQDSNYLKLLQWAAELYEIGLVLSHNDYHKHGAYILAHADLAGFSKPEQTFLADLVRTHRGGLQKALSALKYKNHLRTNFIWMMLVFRLAVIFTRSRKALPHLDIIRLDGVGDNQFNLLINQEWLDKNPLTLYSINEEIVEWELLKININLIKF